MLNKIIPTVNKVNGIVLAKSAGLVDFKSCTKHIVSNPTVAMQMSVRISFLFIVPSDF